MSARWVTVENHGEGWMFGCRLCGNETYQPPCGNLDQALEGMREYLQDHEQCAEPSTLHLPLHNRLDGEPAPAWYTEDQ